MATAAQTDPQALNRVDQDAMPEWGEAADGRRVRIYPDPQLIEEWGAWQAGACQHDRLLIHKRLIAGGATMYQRRCTYCAMAVGNWMKHLEVAALEAQGAKVAEKSIEHFDNRNDRYRIARGSDRDALANRAAERQQPTRRAEAAADRASPEYLALRARVITRDGGLCQGCLSAPAEEVHHLSYAHRGAEFAFELISLCEACHERWHAQ